MRQLGGLDNLMIEGVIPNIPLHMSALMVYDTGGKKGTTALFKALQENFDEIVERHFPILRCRIEDVNALQARLNRLAVVNPKVTVDGKYGDDTATAIRQALGSNAVDNGERCTGETYEAISFLALGSRSP